jgi:hypothetical protein
MGTLTLRKNWLLGGYTATYQVGLSLSLAKLSELVDLIIRTLLPTLLAPNTPCLEEVLPSSLRDFKGRNKLDTLLPNLPVASHDELLRVGGSVAVEDHGTDFSWESFDLCCYSPFLQFEGNHHIIHGVQLERSGALPAWIPLRQLGCAAPLTPRYLRLGLEHFRSLLTFASLGYAPQVTESLLLDAACAATADQVTLNLQLTAESRARSPQDPFEEVAPFNAAACIVRHVTGCNVAYQYTTLLQKEWRTPL